jgi:acyl carrier protein
LAIAVPHNILSSRQVQNQNAFKCMEQNREIRQAIKAMLVEDLMLQVTVDEIGDDQELFGPNGLGLDSVDALQLVVALDKKFGLKIPDPETARTVLKSVGTLTEAVCKHQGKVCGACESASQNA